MSAPQPPRTDAPGNGADPSMEDILASIRRILSEDETPPVPAEKDVLVLDQSMEIPPEPGGEVEHRSETMSAALPEMPAEQPPPPPRPEMSHLNEPAFSGLPEPAPEPQPEPSPALAPAADRPGLVAPETESAAASAMGGLMRRLSLERGAAVYRGGPTVEDLVREEIRPLLKSWLDANLPGLVEQLVREEIERVVKRASF